MVVDIRRLLVRYNGIGKELSSDERELVLFALYNESEARGGIAADARRDCEKELHRQRTAKQVPANSDSAMEAAIVAEESALKCARCGGIKVWHSENGFLDIPCPDCGGRDAE